MEYWNIGILGFNPATLQKILHHYSTIPMFHCSIKFRPRLPSEDHGDE
jgi:hypothetical protein